MFPDLISSIKKGTQRISIITNSLKSFSRDDPAKKTLIRIEESLDTAVTICGSHFKNVAEVITDVQESLPEMMGNSQQMEQVFTNLIVNACDAIKEKIEKLNLDRNKFTGEIVISLRHRKEEGGQIEIHIQDNGSGMKKEVEEKIFTPFFTTKPPAKGTGLGMSIVYGIIKDHDGRITCKSNINKGTEFTIVFPAASGKTSQENCS